MPKKKLIREQNDSLSLLIARFKELIEKFDNEKEPIYLKEATELYLNNIVKTATDIRKLKYIVNQVYKDEDNDTYHLIQEPYTQSQLQILVPNTENKIISYVV